MKKKPHLPAAVNRKAHSKSITEYFSVIYTPLKNFCFNILSLSLSKILFLTYFSHYVLLDFLENISNILFGYKTKYKCC